METRALRDAIRFSDEKMQKVALFESDRYFCDAYCLKPGQDQRIHSHPASEKIYFVVEGAALFHIAGEERRCGAGEAVLARAGQDHGVRNDTGSNAVLLVFMTPRP